MDDTTLITSSDDATWIRNDDTRSRLNRPMGFPHRSVPTDADEGPVHRVPEYAGSRISTLQGMTASQGMTVNGSPGHGTAPCDDTDAVLALKRGFDALADNIGKVVVGKSLPVRLCVTALLAGGHVLIEDEPGTGKTQLAKGLARSLDVSFGRIQFTADLLPSDILGVTFYDRDSSSFSFRPGPVFASIVLADEINRASAKTQSALLEVMDEHRVTADGTVHDVPQPFMVVATQNPADHLGTYRLPEAQLDRFMIVAALGHPGHETSLALARQLDVPDRSATVSPVLDGPRVLALRRMAGSIHVAAGMLDYAVRVVEHVRRSEATASGPSTRGLLALVRCARIWAAADGRGHVIPDDIKTLAPFVIAHRLALRPDAVLAGDTGGTVVSRALDEVPVPRSGIESKPCKPSAAYARKRMPQRDA